MVYTDNRFDDEEIVAYYQTLPVGPRGRHATFTVNAKALVGYPGWYSVHCYSDYDDSLEASSRDILITICEMRDAWVSTLNKRFRD